MDGRLSAPCSPGNRPAVTVAAGWKAAAATAEEGAGRERPEKESPGGSCSRRCDEQGCETIAAQHDLGVGAARRLAPPFVKASLQHNHLLVPRHLLALLRPAHGLAEAGTGHAPAHGAAHARRRGRRQRGRLPCCGRRHRSHAVLLQHPCVVHLLLPLLLRMGVCLLLHKHRALVLLRLLGIGRCLHRLIGRSDPGSVALPGCVACCSGRCRLLRRICLCFGLLQAQARACGSLGLRLCLCLRLQLSLLRKLLLQLLMLVVQELLVLRKLLLGLLLLLLGMLLLLLLLRHRGHTSHAGTHAGAPAEASLLWHERRHSTHKACRNTGTNTCYHQQLLGGTKGWHSSTEATLPRCNTAGTAAAKSPCAAGTHQTAASSLQGRASAPAAAAPALAAAAAPGQAAGWHCRASAALAAAWPPAATSAQGAAAAGGGGDGGPTLCLQMQW